MIPITVTPDMSVNPWLENRAEIHDYANNHPGPAVVEKIGLLPEGTTSGRATVELLIRMPDGTVVLAETTLRLFRLASAALLASPIAEAEADS